MFTHFDVLIIGAGVSGIGVACRLAMACPGKRVGILERRDAIGGTWDLFRFPGVRSDSAVSSYGYAFRPWNDLQVLADGPAIRRYVEATASEYGVDRRIVFGIRTTQACWHGDDRHWTISAIDEHSGEPRSFTCGFLVNCTGYYNYDHGHQPEWPGIAQFQGQCVHPQHWPEGLDCGGKRVVVIGSGATAVTLVPALASTAAHVTMLQRSPGYVVSIPAHDTLSSLLRGLLPPRWVQDFARWRDVARQRLFYRAARRWPASTRRLLLAGVRRQVGGHVDMRHFSPRYQPWDERVCVVPDADLFKALRAGKASVVTDDIDTFTATGIRLKSGGTLEADLIVSATGLTLQAFGGMVLKVDGVPRPLNALMTYKGVLLQDVPNMAWFFGYTNTSWTLKIDLAACYLCRLLETMDRAGFDTVTPHAPAGEMQDESIMDSLQSGYVRRSSAMLPRQGRGPHWRISHRYEQDRAMLLDEPVEDAALSFLARRPGSGDSG